MPNIRKPSGSDPVELPILCNALRLRLTMSFPDHGPQSNWSEVSIDSTNATESDLPRRGRVLGYIFSCIAHKLEVLLNGLTRRRVFMRNYEVDSDSMNATESDLPGRGRVLGCIFSHIGHKLEAFLSELELAGRKILGHLKRISPMTLVRRNPSFTIANEHT